jgi:hypothetical protein
MHLPYGRLSNQTISITANVQNVCYWIILAYKYLTIIWYYQFRVPPNSVHALEWTVVLHRIFKGCWFIMTKKWGKMFTSEPNRRKITLLGAEWSMKKKKEESSAVWVSEQFAAALILLFLRMFQHVWFILNGPCSTQTKTLLPFSVAPAPDFHCMWSDA